METKKCKQCGKKTPLPNGFYKNASRPNGLQDICKQCSLARTAKSRLNRTGHLIEEMNKPCPPLHPAYNQLTMNVKGIGR